LKHNNPKKSWKLGITGIQNKNNTHPKVSTGEKSAEKKITHYYIFNIYTLIGNSSLGILTISIKEIRQVAYKPNFSQPEALYLPKNFERKCRGACSKFFPIHFSSTKPKSKHFFMQKNFAKIQLALIFLKLFSFFFTFTKL
jgi:hypothetical protein